MKSTIAGQYFRNYILMFVLSLILAAGALALLDFSDHVISTTLMKNQFRAADLIREDYLEIDAAPVVNNGGGIQVISRAFEIVRTEGLDTIQKETLTPAEFTDFLTNSRRVGVKYSYDVAYSPAGQYWLVVTFPTSVRIDFAVVHNEDYPSADSRSVTGYIAAVLIFYLLLLALSTLLYSRITSIGVLRPLRKLVGGTKRLRDGDYSARVKLNLKNEFRELEDTFNAMAERIEKETILREQAENRRRKLILDLSHDLKSPLAGIMGYAELCLGKELRPEERESFLKIILENSRRADRLLKDLFELSKLDSPEFRLEKSRTDLSEYLREEMAKYLPLLESAGFGCAFQIPEEELPALIDEAQMDRVFQNLVDNAVRYNPPGTNLSVTLEEQADAYALTFRDDGTGMPEELSEEIFSPFVRADEARNPQTGGTGLGLAIVKKIVEAHGGSVQLQTAPGKGCAFLLLIPKI